MNALVNVIRPIKKVTFHNYLHRIKILQKQKLRNQPSQESGCTFFFEITVHIQHVVAMS